MPCQDITFEAEVTDIGPKLIVMDGVCWNKTRTVKLAARGLFKILYKNPQPFLHSVFRFFVNKFGRPLFLSIIINPILLLNLMKLFQKKKKEEIIYEMFLCTVCLICIVPVLQT